MDDQIESLLAGMRSCGMPPAEHIEVSRMARRLLEMDDADADAALAHLDPGQRERVHPLMALSPEVLLQAENEIHSEQER